MLVLRSEVRADDAEGAGFGVRAGGVVFDEERGGVVAGVAVFFEEERGAEPGGEGLAALAVGIEDVAKVVVVGAEGGVVWAAWLCSLEESRSVQAAALRSARLSG